MAPPTTSRHRGLPLLLRPLRLVAVAVVLVAAATAPTAAADYDPSLVDWASVVESCAAAIRFERRLGSFAIRSAFTDAGSVTPECAVAASPGPDCGGADGSLLVSEAEQLHPHSRNELYAANTAKFVLPIAKKFGASVADTLAVCSLTAPAILAYPAGMLPEKQNARAVRDYIVLRSAVASGFRVGRVDRQGPGNDPSLLPSETLTARGFADWFTSRGISLGDAIALMGVHTLLRPKGCYVEDRVNQRTGLPNSCNPFAPATPGAKPIMPSDSGPFNVAKGSCPMAAMVRWSTEYYNDMCGTKGEGAAVVTTAPRSSQPLSVGQPGFAQQVGDAVCGYRSEAFRADAVKRQLSGQFITPPTIDGPSVISWSCPATGCRVNPRFFPFTQNDASLSAACRAGAPTPPPAPTATAEEDAALARDISAAMLKYTGSSGAQQWAIDFGKAFAKMSAMGAQWAPKSFAATLSECKSWTHENATNIKNVQMCQKRCPPVVLNGVNTADCPNACVCSSAAPRVLKTPIEPATGAFTSAP